MSNLTIVKVGGKIVEEPDTLAALIADFARIDGPKLLVHGGGRSATRIASQLGIEQKMVDGRRITDIDTLRVVTMVYGGLVNKNIVTALQAAGIAWEYVPGVTSAVAVPGAAGIPVTHRGVSRSFCVVTARTADSADGLPENLEELAHLPGTLVFLMGLSRLEEIARGLTGAGLPPDTPVAVIGGKNAPRTIRGTLGDIAERAREAAAPAVIVVGGTAGMDLRG